MGDRVAPRFGHKNPGSQVMLRAQPDSQSRGIPGLFRTRPRPLWVERDTGARPQRSSQHSRPSGYEPDVSGPTYVACGSGNRSWVLLATRAQGRGRPASHEASEAPVHCAPDIGPSPAREPQQAFAIPMAARRVVEPSLRVGIRSADR